MITTPAALLGASRAFRRRHHRWLRKRVQGEVTYTPPRGVTVDAETGEVRYAMGPAQLAVYQDSTRFRVLIAGRRFGKSHGSGVELITPALEETDGVFWYVAPTRVEARDMMWDRLKAMIPPWYLYGEPNESRLEIRLVTGSLLALKGADHPNRLRGRGLRKVVCDEFTFMKERAWTEALRPSLSDTEGSALFIGTPAGYNWGYDLWRKGQPGADPADAREWRSWQFTTAQGGRVKPTELAAAARMLAPAIFRQEYGATFETLQGRVYAYFAEAWHVDSTILDDGGPVIVGMDFNVNPMTAVIAKRHVCRNGAVELWFLDEIVLPNSNTAEMAAEITRRYPRRLSHPTRAGAAIAGRPVVICPDASGAARKSSAGSGVTDHAILRDAGFVLDVEPSNPLVKDRINNLNALFLSADGVIRCRVHPRCTHLIKAMNGLTWKDNVPDPRSPHIHITDAASYAAWRQFNLLNPSLWATSHFAV